MKKRSITYIRYSFEKYLFRYPWFLCDYLFHILHPDPLKPVFLIIKKLKECETLNLF